MAQIEATGPRDPSSDLWVPLMSTINHTKNQRSESGTNCHFWNWEIFVMSVDTSVEELSNVYEPEQFEFCRSHSRNTHFQ